VKTYGLFVVKNRREVRIIQVINQLKGGGAERLVLQLHERFLEAGHESFVISLLDENEDFSMAGIVGLGYSSPWDPRILLSLRTLLVEIEEMGPIHVLHSHLTQSQFWCGWMKRCLISGVKLITTEHDTWNSRRGKWIGKQFDRILYRHYDHLICISNGVEEAMVQNWLPQLSSKTVVVFNGVDLVKFTPPESVLSEKRKFRIISVGRLLPKKNFEVAIRACYEIKELEFEYNIYGEGASREELDNLIKELGLEENVFLRGFDEDIPARMRESDVFLLTSQWEGFGLVVAEAMATRLAVIVSDIPGVREVAGENDKTALLVNPSEVEDVAQALRRLLMDEDLRDRIAKEGKERSQMFCINKMAQKYLALYEGQI
jgi:glycosyltransferase involved in cell wall biosynthesis